MGVECPSDFGANLVQHFIKRYSRCSRYRTKSHDKTTISHDITRYYTIFTISNATLKTQRDNQKNYFKSSVQTGLLFFLIVIWENWHFLLSLREQLSLPYRASEVYSVSEVIYDSEVLPSAKWANLTSLVWSTNFTASQLHFSPPSI